MFELRRLGKVGSIALCGTNGAKFPALRKHLDDKISAVYAGLDVSCATFPADEVERDPAAYKAAMSAMPKGGIVTIFTPDETHFDIAAHAIKCGLHVLVTKPAVKTIQEHVDLLRLADEHGVLVMVEFHKRFDPIYVDARGRAQTYGDFAYFNSFMSQPKKQLEVCYAMFALLLPTYT